MGVKNHLLHLWMKLQKLFKSYHPFRHLYKRLEFWVFWCIVGLVVDEWLKERCFSLYDVVKPFTHENLILILLVFLFIYQKRFKR